MFHAAYPARKAAPAFRRAINFRMPAAPRNRNLPRAFPPPFPPAFPKVFLFSGGREILPARSSTRLKFRRVSPATRPYPLHRNEHIFRVCTAPSTTEVRAAAGPFSIYPRPAELFHIRRVFLQQPALDQRQYSSRKFAKAADDP